MFESIERVPGDAILGLTQQFQDDPNPDKVDLGVGVYRNDSGVTPILESVKEAERRRVENEQSKAYVGAHGVPGYGEAILQRVLGQSSRVLADQRASATQSIGGTGALRLAAEFIKSQLPGKSVWVSDPTWGNHLAIFNKVGLDIQTYPYVNENNRLDFDAMITQLQSIPEGDVLLLHACCHNPTGFDPGRKQWERILEVIQQRNLLPLVDFAYQGFGDGLDDDAFGVRLLAENLDEMLITQSCSKNFGLYRERIGTFIAIAAQAEQAENIRTQMAQLARANYSTPAAHGGSIVATILNSSELTQMWQQELEGMRDRINAMRQKLVVGFEPHGLAERFEFINEQRGMFSFTGLNADQVARLRDEYSIYMVANGRANVAGLRDDNIDYVCQAIADVIDK